MPSLCPARPHSACPEISSHVTNTSTDDGLVIMAIALVAFVIFAFVALCVIWMMRPGDHA